MTEDGAVHKIKIIDLVCDESVKSYDYGLEGSFTVSSIALYNDTIIYSRFFDHYQYRVITISEEGVWKETGKGPLI